MKRLSIILGLVVIGVGLLPARGPATETKHAVLDYTIRCDKRDSYTSTTRICRLINVNDTSNVLFRGTRKQAERELIKRLKQKHGQGNPNLPFLTLGGKQFWGDVFIHDNWRIQENVFTGHTRLLDPNDVRKAWGDYEGTRTYFERIRLKEDIRNDSSHLVLLVHGIFRSKDSLSRLKKHLEYQGYEVAAVNYPSTQQSISKHAKQIEQLLDRTIGINRVSFVSHSMGGLVIRSLLGKMGKWRERIDVNAVVMMAPPNQGAEISDSLKDVLPYRLVTGQSGQNLTTEEVKNLYVPRVPVGIIAGSNDAGEYNPLVDGRSDFTVSVESTKLKGQDDFLTIDSIHSFLMNNPEAIEATATFLKTKEF